MSDYIIPADEERFEEEVAGVVRAPRPPSLASEYLMEAIESLHAAGDAGHLFAFWRQHPPSDLPVERPKMTQAARRTRLRAARNAVIYAAFSAEAYVTEFLAAHDALDDWDREPMHRKFLKGTEAAYGSPLFFADREAYPEIVELVKLRDRLAHPKPGFGVTGVHFEADAKYARLFSLPQIRGIHSDGRWRWRSARATPMAWTKWMSSPVWHGGAEKSFGSTPVGIGDYPPGTRRASDSCSDRQETK